MKKIIRRIFSSHILLVALLTIVIPTVLMQIGLSKKKDIYPYYGWEMFKGVEPERHYYTIELMSESGVYKDLFKNRYLYLNRHGIGIYSFIQKESRAFHKSKIYQETFEKKINKLIRNKYLDKKIRVSYNKIDKTEYVTSKLINRQIFFESNDQ